MRTLLTKALATTAVAIGTVVTFSWGTLGPGETAQAARAASNGPVLVELFTSQGCSSCPPAEALLKELAQTPGVVAIEWHVDYWDTLAHRGSSWQDPFSNAAYTARQRAYNRALRGTNGVYTPQAVIAGQYETVGSSRSKVLKHINAAPAAAFTVQTAQDGDDLSVHVSGQNTAPSSATVRFIRLLKSHETVVSRGENKGRDLSGAHVVLEAVTLGELKNGQDQSYALPPLNPGETCAVIIQSTARRLGPALGAAYCPS